MVWRECRVLPVVFLLLQICTIFSSFTFAGANAGQQFSSLQQSYPDASVRLGSQITKETYPDASVRLGSQIKKETYPDASVRLGKRIAEQSFIDENERLGMQNTNGDLIDTFTSRENDISEFTWGDYISKSSEASNKAINVSKGKSYNKNKEINSIDEAKRKNKKRAGKELTWGKYISQSDENLLEEALGILESSTDPTTSTDTTDNFVVSDQNNNYYPNNTDSEIRISDENDMVEVLQALSNILDILPEDDSTKKEEIHEEINEIESLSVTPSIVFESNTKSPDLNEKATIFTGIKSADKDSSQRRHGIADDTKFSDNNIGDNTHLSLQATNSTDNKPPVAQRRMLDLLYHMFVDPTTDENGDRHNTMFEDVVRAIDDHIIGDIKAYRAHKESGTKGQSHYKENNGKFFKTLIESVGLDTEFLSESAGSFAALTNLGSNSNPTNAKRKRKISPLQDVNIIQQSFNSNGNSPTFQGEPEIETLPSGDEFLIKNPDGTKQLITINDIINSLAALDENDLTDLLTDTELTNRRSDALDYEDISFQSSENMDYFSKSSLTSANSLSYLGSNGQMQTVPLDTYKDQENVNTKNMFNSNPSTSMSNPKTTQNLNDFENHIFNILQSGKAADSTAQKFNPESSIFTPSHNTAQKFNPQSSIFTPTSPSLKAVEHLVGLQNQSPNVAPSPTLQAADLLLGINNQHNDRNPTVNVQNKHAQHEIRETLMSMHSADPKVIERKQMLEQLEQKLKNEQDRLKREEVLLKNTQMHFLDYLKEKQVYDETQMDVGQKLKTSVTHKHNSNNNAPSPPPSTPVFYNHQPTKYKSSQNKLHRYVTTERSTTFHTPSSLQTSNSFVTSRPHPRNSHPSRYYNERLKKYNLIAKNKINENERRQMAQVMYEQVSKSLPKAIHFKHTPTTTPPPDATAGLFGLSGISNIFRHSHDHHAPAPVVKTQEKSHSNGVKNDDPLGLLGLYDLVPFYKRGEKREKDVGTSHDQPQHEHTVTSEDRLRNALNDGVVPSRVADILLSQLNAKKLTSRRSKIPSTMKRRSSDYNVSRRNLQHKSFPRNKQIAQNRQSYKSHYTVHGQEQDEVNYETHHSEYYDAPYHQGHHDFGPPHIKSVVPKKHYNKKYKNSPPHYRYKNYGNDDNYDSYIVPIGKKNPPQDQPVFDLSFLFNSVKVDQQGEENASISLPKIGDPKHFVNVHRKNHY